MSLSSGFTSLDTEYPELMQNLFKLNFCRFGGLNAMSTKSDSLPCSTFSYRTAHANTQQQLHAQETKHNSLATRGTPILHDPTHLKQAHNGTQFCLTKICPSVRRFHAFNLPTICFQATVNETFRLLSCNGQDSLILRAALGLVRVRNRGNFSSLNRLLQSFCGACEGVPLQRKSNVSCWTLLYVLLLPTPLNSTSRARTTGWTCRKKLLLIFYSKHGVRLLSSEYTPAPPCTPPHPPFHQVWLNHDKEEVYNRRRSVRTNFFFTIDFRFSLPRVSRNFPPPSLQDQISSKWSSQWKVKWHSLTLLQKVKRRYPLPISFQ